MKLMIGVCVPPKDGVPSQDAVSEYMQKVKDLLEAGDVEVSFVNVLNPERMYAGFLESERAMGNVITREQIKEYLAGRHMDPPKNYDPRGISVSQWMVEPDPEKDVQ